MHKPITINRLLELATLRNVPMETSSDAFMFAAHLPKSDGVYCPSADIRAHFRDHGPARKQGVLWHS